MDRRSFVFWWAVHVAQVLSSERFDGEKLYRKRAQVYPETGCALDDLAVERTITNIPLDKAGNKWQQFSDGYVLLQEPDDELQPVEVVITRGQSDRRVRCKLMLDTSAKKVVRAITIAKERLYSEFNDGNYYRGQRIVPASARAVLHSEPVSLSSRCCAPAHSTRCELDT